jgi:hypothetical protein
MSERAIRARLTDANDQLAALGLHGAVVLDLTDCIGESTPRIVESEGERLGTAVDEIIWDGIRNQLRAGFERIILVSSVVRGAFQLTESEPIRINFVNVSASTVFTRTTGSLLDHHAQWLRARIQPGLFWDGFEVTERRRA